MTGQHLALQSIAIAFLVLTGCASVPLNDESTAQIADCVGEIAATPTGLSPSVDDKLLRAAIGEVGKGKLCEGQVFVATEAVTVYRVWNKAQAYSQYGGWWSFNVPEGPVAAYREANAICPEWSALDTVSSCQLVVDAKIVVGPGQRAQCDDVVYPRSPTNQVYIPNDSLKGVLFVDQCTEGVPWP